MPPAPPTSGANRLRISTVVAVCAALALSACASSSGAARLKGITRDRPLEVGSASLTDVTDPPNATATTDGRFVFRAAPGELLVVYFGYLNCPDLCPTTMAELRAAKRSLGDDAARIDLAMVTVDPARDDAATMNAYLGGFADRYHALRPENDDELKAAEAVFLASSSVTLDATGAVQDVAHTANTYVVDENGLVVVEWPFGIGTDGMVNDLSILLDEITS